MEPASKSLDPVLAAVGLVGSVGIVVTAAYAPDLLAVVGGGMLLSLAASVLGAARALTFPVAFVGVVFLSLAAQGNDAGTDLAEVLFGVALLGFVASWYAHALIGGRRIIRNRADLALACFIVVGGVGGFVLALLTGPNPADLRGDLTTLLGLSLYFPAREICFRTKRGPEVLAGLLLLLGVAAAGTNVARLVSTLSGATAIYEIVDVRVASGEIPLTASLLIALAWLTSTDNRRMNVLLSLVATASIGGLILAKSRGPWITALFGILLIVLLSAPGKRKRLVATVAAGMAGLGLLGVLVLGDELFLIGLGLLQRFASLSTAATSDISLINRYAESAAVWSAIKANPFIGYGWGAPVVRYDLITQFTYQTGFVHNGYLWLWHKVGIGGLVLFVAGYGSVVWQSTMASLARREGASLAAGAVGALVAYAILAFPSNPFAVMDQMLVVALMLALASGIYERQRAGTSRS